MRGTPLGKKHTLAWFGLGFRALVRALGLFQTFSWAHYSKLFLIDKIVSSMELGIPDFVRYKMGCLQSETNLLRDVQDHVSNNCLCYLAREELKNFQS